MNTAPATFDPSLPGTLPPPPETIVLDFYVIDNIRRLPLSVGPNGTPCPTAGFTDDPPQVFQAGDLDNDLTVRVVRRHVGATGDVEWVDVGDPAYSLKEFRAITAGLVCDGDLTRAEAAELVNEAAALIARPQVSE
jgi:hypothetical protein